MNAPSTLVGMPQTPAQGNDFLREYCDAQIKLNEDSDVFRCVCRGYDADGIGVLIQVSVELPLNDKAEADRLYLLAVQKVYSFWITLEQKEDK